LAIVKLFGFYVRYIYNKGRKILGNIPSPLKDQKLIERYARDYYNPGLTGGEGHMEVGKHIYMIKHKKAHMIISVKPFGCMPFKSRIMMKLYEAKMKALEEYENIKKRVGSVEVIYTKANRKLPEKFVTTACNYLSTLYPL